ncbi:recombination-associated protein RdgC, partial [Escherichia coli]|uniref:recombination-associated protein RdgC n=1 Tax=Escherichia coli TaxID=562 RepID=UPI00156047A9
ILRGVRQQQDEPGRFSICSRQAAVVQQNSDIDNEDVAQRLDADFFLLTSEISCLVDALVNALGGEAKQ